MGNPILPIPNSHPLLLGVPLPFRVEVCKKWLQYKLQNKTMINNKFCEILEFLEDILHMYKKWRYEAEDIKDLRID